MAGAMILAFSIAALLTIACVSAPLTKHGIDVVGRAQIAASSQEAVEERSSRPITRTTERFSSISTPRIEGDGSGLLTDQNARLLVLYVRVNGADIAGAIEPYSTSLQLHVTRHSRPARAAAIRASF